MRTYIPIAELEKIDPAWAERVRVRDREKQRRLRAADPEGASAKEAARYQTNKAAHKVNTNRWRRQNPDACRAMKLKYWRESRAKYIVQAVRGEAKQKGVAFSLSAEWVQARLDAGTCELSGLPFDLESRRKNLKDMPSIDRRDPSGDYVEENCRMILFGLNSLIRRGGDAIVPIAVARIKEMRAAIQ